MTTQGERKSVRVRVRAREKIVCVFVSERECVCVMGIGSLIITVSLFDVNGGSEGGEQRALARVRARGKLCM